MFRMLKRIFLGAPINPLNPEVRRHIALIALFAWVGLGADALSSSCYGPEQAYLALGHYPHLALYIVALTVITIFIIAIGYNQVIELFPSGGGGYKVASKLLNPYVGLISGAALLVDYVLTITVSIASGTDAIFSFLPYWMHHYKFVIEASIILLLLILNVRGMKEAIQVLFPIFLGFVIIHIILILYGIIMNSHGLTSVIPGALADTKNLAASIGWVSVLGLTLHAYSLGGGTYTGLEAVSNNVQRLVEPRVQTGKRTMLYMAISLSFTAGGIILLYLLYYVKPIPGQTLNAVLFHSILGDSWLGQTLLIITLELEAGLLLVAANTGFAAGPNVLANMAIDGWVPNRFRHLSNRLVVQNGLILFGVAALGVLYWTHGNIAILVVLYSINVFITFSLALLGVSVYWIKHRATSAWLGHLVITGFACLITTMVLCITIYYKFREGGWFTLLITFIIILICFVIKRHYEYIANKFAELDRLLEQPTESKEIVPLAINPQLPTAIIFVNSLSVGMHTLLTILRLFPGQFKNFVFLTAGAVDVESFSGQEEFEKMQASVNKVLDYFVKYCNQYQLPAEGYAAFGTDPTEELKLLAEKVSLKYKNAIFFCSQTIFKRENILTRLLHNQTPLILQHHLHFLGRELMILPMRL